MSAASQGGPPTVSGDRLRYDRMVETALRGVIRAALDDVAEHGLPGAHHFYITFRTAADGVDIPEYLKTEYPGVMTIVVQHQFWGLETDDDGFEITLSFRKVHERLRVPWAAVAAFADPAVNFALQFEGAAEEMAGLAPPHDGAGAVDETAVKADEAADEPKTTGDVVTVDFRKKRQT